jgi:hypothetical protein
MDNNEVVYIHAEGFLLSESILNKLLTCITLSLFEGHKTELKQYALILLQIQKKCVM